MASLSDVDYSEPGASDIWRWVDSAGDAAVRAYVSEYVVLVDDDRAAARAQIGEAANDVLVTYARRCALAAVRTRALRAVVDGFEALSVLPLGDAPDDRDIAVAAMLLTHAGHQLTDDLTAAVDEAIGRSEPDLAELLAEIVEEMGDLTEESGYREIELPGGRGFVEDNEEAFEPTVDLLGAAWAVAGVIERENYHVDDIGVGQRLSPVYWDEVGQPEAAAAATRARGCVEVRGGRVDDSGWHSLTVYIAQTRSGPDAALIVSTVDGDRHGRRLFALTDREVCAIVLASTEFGPGEPAESDESLARFRPGVADALAAFAG
jgi:hypothetical protein